MTKIVIIGAGGVGGVVTHKCAQVAEVFSDITLASRTLSKCEKIAEQVKKAREERLKLQKLMLIMSMNSVHSYKVKTPLW